MRRLRWSTAAPAVAVNFFNERLDADARELAWPAFAERNADLMTWKPSILARYYREETLASPKAKRTFVMPDRLQTADAINERAKSGKD